MPRLQACRMMLLGRADTWRMCAQRKRKKFKCPTSSGARVRFWLQNGDERQKGRDTLDIATHWLVNV